MDLETFKLKRKDILSICKAEVKEDAYSRVGHAIKSATLEDPDDKSYHKSISAHMIKSGKFIREPIMKDGKLDDYNILPNPNYLLTQFQKAAIILAFIFSLTTLIVQIVNVQMAKANQAGQKELQEKVSSLQKQVEELRKSSQPKN